MVVLGKCCFEDFVLKECTCAMNVAPCHSLVSGTGVTNHFSSQFYDVNIGGEARDCRD